MTDQQASERGTGMKKVSWKCSPWKAVVWMWSGEWSQICPGVPQSPCCLAPLNAAVFLLVRGDFDQEATKWLPWMKLCHNLLHRSTLCVNPFHAYSRGQGILSHTSNAAGVTLFICVCTVLLLPPKLELLQSFYIVLFLFSTSLPNAPA